MNLVKKYIKSYICDSVEKYVNRIVKKYVTGSIMCFVKVIVY